MDHFTVPQFIDVEDKIIGPITTRQFVIVMLTFFLITATYAAADFSLFIFLAVIEGFLGAILAFARINGRPFHYFILNIIQTLKRPSLRVWKKEPTPGTLKETIALLHPITVETLVDHSRAKTIDRATLKELALIVDTGGKYTGEEI